MNTKKVNTKKVSTKKVTKTQIGTKQSNDLGLKRAKAAKTLALILGILFAVQLIGEIIFQAVHTAPRHGEDTFAIFVLYMRSCLCIAEMVLAIIIWANTKHIKQHTKANILLFIVGLPVLFGVTEIVEIVVIALAYAMNQIPDAIGWPCQVILWLALIGSSAISFIGFAQIKNSIK